MRHEQLDVLPSDQARSQHRDSHSAHDGRP
jgi:hypothetical protein